MKELKRVQVESRDQLRDWLRANHSRTESIWLVTFKKHVTGKHVSWDEVVEEALCVGWIDSTARKLDADRHMQLLSPRRPGSTWSRINKQRIEKLIAANLMMPAGLAAIERAKEDGTWTILDEIEELAIPPDLEAALAGNETAAQHFHAFSPSVKKVILWRIKSARTPATRAKRVAETVGLAQHNLSFTHPDARGSLGGGERVGS